MRLKQHRQDVKDLQLMDDNHVQEIAKRYQRLILMAEEAMPKLQYTERRYKVVKDAKG